MKSGGRAGRERLCLPSGGPNTPVLSVLKSSDSQAAGKNFAQIPKELLWHSAHGRSRPMYLLVRVPLLARRPCSLFDTGVRWAWWPLRIDSEIDPAEDVQSALIAPVGGKPLTGFQKSPGSRRKRITNKIENRLNSRFRKSA